MRLYMQRFIELLILGLLSNLLVFSSTITIDRGTVEHQATVARNTCITALTDSTQRTEACRKSTFLTARVMSDTAGKIADATVSTIGVLYATAGALTGCKALSKVGKGYSKLGDEIRKYFTAHSDIVEPVVIGLSAGLITYFGLRSRCV